tara:strand:+ start:711 stop:1496 length:786 start_codon:yes stop_codon:yes gene_type:complete
MTNEKNYPLVSIIMNCYNGEKFLEESLQSIIKQSYQNWELIFWDNLSSDTSSKIIKRYKDLRIKYYLSGKFEKLYKARNSALEKTKGDYICFLDTDDTWDQDFLKSHIKKILELKCDVVYSKYLILNEFRKKTYLNEKGEIPSGMITTNLLKRYLIGVNAILLNKKIFDEFRFNPKYEIIGDFDFFLRLSLCKKFFPIQEAFLTYRHHPNNFTNTNIDIYIKELKDWIKENEYLFEKISNLNRLKINVLKLQIKKIFKFFF